MEKAKITKEEAKALDLFINVHRHEPNPKDAALAQYFRCRDDWKDNLLPLSKMGSEKVVAALYVGYEVVLTPHEQVEDFFDGNPDPLIRFGIRGTLDRLGVKLKGVNA